MNEDHFRKIMRQADEVAYIIFQDEHKVMINTELDIAIEEMWKKYKEGKNEEQIS